jgi:SpoIVB peptidase S55
LSDHRGVRGRIALVVALAGLSAAIAAAPATAAPPTPPLPPCAQTVSPDQLSEGQNLIGYSVTHGTTVESFNAKVLGIMPGGIAPGRDLVIVRASGAPIAQAGGIWFGMSGSPVYTLGGKLVGAVSFGFSATSTIAGLTPAEDMVGGLLGDGSAGPAPRSVRLSPALRARVERQPGAPPKRDSGQMSALEVPLSISGISPQRRATLRRQAIKHHMPFFVPAVAGSSVSGKGLSSNPMHPGDSFAAATSYGDITSAGVGTTTYVCNGEALAFGHPFFFSGPSELGAGGATALGIVEDPLFGPYKLANVTEPTGVVEQDRLEGLQAQLGQAPSLVPITQHTRALDTGAERTGETDAVQGTSGDLELDLPFVAWIHAFSNIDSVFDQISGGSSSISWTIRGIKEPSGKRWSLTRGNRWVSNGDISFGSTFELLDTLEALSHQKLAKIAFTGVDIDVDVEQTVHELKIRKVLWSKNRRGYRRERALRVKPGQRLFAEVKMRDSDTHHMRTRKLSLRVPRHAHSLGVATIGGGGSSGGGGFAIFECAFFGECGGGGGKAKTFDSLVKNLESAPRNDDLVATINSRRASSRKVQGQPKVVKGHKVLLLKISSGHHHRHRGRLVRGVAPGSP